MDIAQVFWNRILFLSYTCVKGMLSNQRQQESEHVDSKQLIKVTFPVKCMRKSVRYDYECPNKEKFAEKVVRLARDAYF